MQGAPHRQARGSARSFFALPLSLALLALVAFPVFAHGAGIPDYKTPTEDNQTHINRESTEPNDGGGELPSGNETQKPAHGSDAPGATDSEEPSEESSDKNSKDGGGTPGGNGNGPSSGSPEGEGPGSEGSVGPAQEVGGESASGLQVANQTESGGGSSPVVPILIAVVVLAAISIGVVIYRQRKGGPGQSSRVSSTNAR